MRDLIILAVLVVSTLWALREPWLGVILWTLVSLMSPHVQFGYAAAAWPVATGVGICTLVGLLFTRHKQNPFVHPAVWALLAFCVWICITLPFSIYFDESLTLWERSMKIFLMLFATLMLIDDRRKLEIFIWTIVISIGYYGVKGGLFTIATGGNYRIWGPGGFIGGNNELALALVATIPLMRYLQLQVKNPWLSRAMLVGMGLCAVAAIGTYSRGALLGVAAIAGYFWLKGSNKLVWGVAFLVGGLVLLPLMPEQWWDRMSTIRTYDADDSALGRINAWWMAFNLAKDRLFGGGFMIYYAPVFYLYAPEPDRVHAAHSIYFQVLGEHGFIGLLLFLSIGAGAWMAARSMIQIGKRDPALKWAADLGAMAQLSMVGYGVTGAFLSLSYFDLPYNVMAICVLANHMLKKKLKADAAQHSRKPAVDAQPTQTPLLPRESRNPS
jgi:putative inorganic carbon (hco3(-)) transporter